MKKWFGLLLIVNLLVGCSTNAPTPKEQEAKIFHLDKQTTIDEHMSYQIRRIAKSPRITPPNPDGIINLYEVDNPENTYLDVTMTIKNLYQTPKSVDELIDISYTINDENFSAFAIAESKKSSMFDTSPVIPSLNEQTIHFLAEIPNIDDKALITLQATINDKKYKTSFTLQDTNKLRTSAKVKEIVKRDNFAQVIIDDIYYTNIVEPPMSRFLTTYYEADENNVYLVIENKVKNLKSSELAADEIMSFSALLDNYYEYTGFATVESVNQEDLNYANITSLPALGERKIYYLIEIPKELQQKDVKITMWFKGDYYDFSFDENLKFKEVTTSSNGEAAGSQENELEKQQEQPVTPPVSPKPNNVQPTIRKGHTNMTTQEVLDLISHNEGIDFSTYQYQMEMDEDGYLIIMVINGPSAIGTYKIDNDGTLLQFDVVQGMFLPAEQVIYGGS